LPHADDVLVPASTRVAGLPIAERVVRAARRAGYSRVIVQSSGPCTDATFEGPVTVVGAGTVVSPALLEAALAFTPAVDGVCDVPAGPDWPESGVLRAGPAAATAHARLASELAARRQRALPLPSGEDVSQGRARLAVRIRTPEELAQAERIIRRSSYKDTDRGFACFNRRISLPISVALMRTPLTANQLSVTLVAVGIYAGWLFSQGRYWTGLVAACLSLAASVLDGCDGEIARLKYQESALGCWIETIGDYLYYIAIFIGITAGTVRQTGSPAFYWIGGLALAGTLATFALLIFLRNRITSGRPERLHAIARDRFQSAPAWWTGLLLRASFIATRAAMPYGILVFAVFDALPAALVVIAILANVYWMALVGRMSELSAVSFQPSAVGSVPNQESAIPTPQSAIPTPQSPIGNQQSAL
jgi:1L-myo-inositol 1-phosphate cytidylyltransferase / CDP-L-myo-inositol myo-inositolphosphotransferase